MGSWGHRSYANDSCMDVLDGNWRSKLFKRPFQPKFVKEIQKITRNAFRNTKPCPYNECVEKELPLGIVIHTLECSPTFPMEEKYLKMGLRFAKFLRTCNRYLDCWKDTERRVRNLDKEIEIIEKALKRIKSS